MDTIRGFDLDKINSFPELLKAYSPLGIQASNLSLADEILWEMVKDRHNTMFFSFTSNVVSSGMREIAAQFIRDAKPKVIITTAGAIEEDIMKSLGDFYLGSFYADDWELRKRGINRIGNIFVPNERYEQLEAYVKPVLKRLDKGSPISVNQLITELSRPIEDNRSFLKAALDTGAKVFCPAVTDGAIGMQLYFYRQQSKRFVLDQLADMNDLAQVTLNAERTGALIIGGGIAKHYTIGVNLMREGLDRAIYISTAQEHDASLSGAYPHEAVSWGKIKSSSRHVLVNDEASISFPLLALSLHQKLRGKVI